MLKPHVLLIISSVLFLFQPSALLADDNPSRVLVIYNAAFPDFNGNGVGDSKEVALYYQAKRGIPQQNMLAVSCSQDFEYVLDPGWKAFFNEVIEPLRARLTILGEEQIYFMVTCFGMPLKFIRNGMYTDRAIDQLLAYPWNIGTAEKYDLPKRWWNNPYLEESPSIPPDQGHFDHSIKFRDYNLYLVTRLSGPTAAHAVDLVDRALYGEQYLWPDPGYYQGTLYIDTQYKAYSDQELQGYPFGYLWYDTCDKSIAYAKFFADASGYDWLWENTSTELEIGDPGATYHTGDLADSAPQALLYAGWYNINKYNDVWEWIPGSAACDLNSLSILEIREPAPASFLANAFLRGLTCGTGVIYEPLTTGHQRPEVFFHAVLNGFNFAEASGLCTPTLCFANMSVGDPLYNPHRSGKLPQLDTIPPPVPRMAISSTPGINTERNLSVGIDTRGRDPDVIVVEVEYGLTAAYGSSIPFGAVFRTKHDLLLDGLVPSTLYHVMARVEDPAGSSAQSQDFIFFTEEPAPLVVDLSPDKQSVPQSTPFDLAFLISSAGGIEQITRRKVTVTAQHLGIVDLNVTGFLASLPYSVEHDPGYDTCVYRFRLPGLASPGTYQVTFEAVHGGTVSGQDLCTIDVF